MESLLPLRAFAAVETVCTHARAPKELAQSFVCFIPILKYSSYLISIGSNHFFEFGANGKTALQGRTNRHCFLNSIVVCRKAPKASHYRFGSHNESRSVYVERGYNNHLSGTNTRLLWASPDLLGVSIASIGEDGL